MSQTPVVLGINRTADASICLVGGTPFICSVQKERYTRRKHHWGARGDVSDVYARRVAALAEPVDLVVECYSSDAESAHVADYHRELHETLRFRGEPHIINISHHLAHVYSAFYIAPAERAAVIITDFQGSYVRDITETWPGRADAHPDHLEVGSFYYGDGQEVRCLGKQLWDGNKERPVGLGCFYNYLTHAIFAGFGMEGKVMGLAPYGDPHALKLPPLIVEQGQVFIPDEWLAVFRAGERFRHFKDGGGSFEEAANLAATGQLRFEEAQLRLAEWMHRQTGAEMLCLSGGTALNCVSNGRLMRESPFTDIFVPPSPHDGGTALGCALYGYIEHFKEHGDFRWVNDFLAPEPDLNGVAELLAAEAELVASQPEELIAQMVDLLESGRTVALFHGRSELGPRALGHRSILADPRHPAIRSWINQHVKSRELFRPLAPVALEESAGRFFEIDRPVPFMQLAVEVRPEQRATIPAVTHVDGTARLQTVNQRQDPFLHALLQAFEARTGVGVLLNTSFNGCNEPIVETPNEAIACFNATALHALAMPPFLIRKRREPEIPERSERERTRQQELMFQPMLKNVSFLSS